MIDSLRIQASREVIKRLATPPSGVQSLDGIWKDLQENGGTDNNIKGQLSVILRNSNVTTFALAGFAVTAKARKGRHPSVDIRCTPLGESIEDMTEDNRTCHWWHVNPEETTALTREIMMIKCEEKAVKISSLYLMEEPVAELTLHDVSKAFGMADEVNQAMWWDAMMNPPEQQAGHV